MHRADALTKAGASGSAGCGGRVARALRLLLLLVLALAAVEYFFGSILDAFPLRTDLYPPLYNSTQRTNRSSLPLNMTSQDEGGSALLITKIMGSIKSLATPEGLDFRITKKELPLCDDPLDLGPIRVNKTVMELYMVNLKYPEVNRGGRYSPPNCTARHKVAIIAPYRDRLQHLAIFLNHMHPFLMKQQIEYGIFIVEQEGNQDFNRGKLMNVGFVESQKLKAGGWQCFIFHDIDLLPLDLRNLYSCPRQPRHMSVSIDKLKFRLPYEEIFGGVSAMTPEQFQRVNGFSNRYWGWGAEDDDMAYRLLKMKYYVARYKTSIARYAMLNHKNQSPNPKRYQILSQTNETLMKDGLSTLEYVLVKVTHHHLFTHILVNIDEHNSWTDTLIPDMERLLEAISSPLFISVFLLIIYVIGTIINFHTYICYIMYVCWYMISQTLI